MEEEVAPACGVSRGRRARGQWWPLGVCTRGGTVGPVRAVLTEAPVEEAVGRPPKFVQVPVILS